MNRIEEVKKILDKNAEDGYWHIRTPNFGKVARQIDKYYSQLFPQPLDDKELERTLLTDEEIREIYANKVRFVTEADILNLSPKKAREGGHQIAKAQLDKALALLLSIEEARKQALIEIFPSDYYPAQLQTWADQLEEQYGYPNANIVVFLRALASNWQALSGKGGENE